MRGVGQYERLGTTIDDALGEAFDKTAKLLGLGFPGGPAVEQIARQGNARRFDLPRPMLGREEPHFSFAGLKTAVRRTAEKLSPLQRSGRRRHRRSFRGGGRRCRCRSLRAGNGSRRGAPRPPSPAALRGCRRRRRQPAPAGDTCETCAKRVASPSTCRRSTLCGDNAAMIAWAGAERLARGMVDPLDAPVLPRWPLDRDAAPAIGAGVKA